MKKQQKQFEYVDQFRKISTLEKLPNLNEYLPSIFQQDIEKDNNNFIRMRKQPQIDKWDNPEHQELILGNQCVEERVYDRLLEEKNQYEKEDHRVKGHINMFKNWSGGNKNTEGKQKFRFFYKQASPPKKISQVPLYSNTNASNNNKQLRQKLYEQLAIDDQNQRETNTLDVFNFNQQDKYDFKLINQKRLEQYMQKPQLQKNIQMQKQEDLFTQTFRKFEKFKTLQSIADMDQWKWTEEEFFYDLDYNQKQAENLKLDQYFHDKFIYKSVVKMLKNTEKDVEYFRDIGLPCRNLQKYTQVLPSLKFSSKQKEHLEQQTKEQAHYLHLLRESELNINKLLLNFDDLSNISNGRVTCLNAYMCIRSQKVTKAQFEKLLKRLDRYKKQEKEKGKQTQEIGIWTEDIEIQFNVNDKNVVKQQKNEINQLVQQIGQIRQSISFLNPKKKPNQIDIKANSFKKQQFTRMQFLLRSLYEKIVKNPAKHPFTSLQNHMDSVHEMLQREEKDGNILWLMLLDEILLDQYKDGRLLWFILDCYQEILNNYPEEDNIKNLLKKKPIQQPKVSHFKNKKLIKQQQLKATHLYTYKDKNQAPTNDKQKSPIRSQQKTPNKTPLASDSLTQKKRVTFNDSSNTNDKKKSSNNTKEPYFKKSN